MSRLAKLAWATLIVNVAVVIYGAYVRATGSGAGCGPSWPTCNGEVIPSGLAGARFIEFTHRVTSALAALMVAVLVIWIIRTHVKGSAIRRTAFWAGIFIISESLVGAILVLAEWVADDTSAARTVMVPVHLINTFLLLGALALLAWWTSGGGSVRFANDPKLARSIVWGLIGIVVISATGGITALADTLFPVESMKEGLSEVADAEHFLTRLRIIHPIVAMAVGTFIGWLAFNEGLGAKGRYSQRLAQAIIGLVILQFFAGMANILLLTPVWLQLTHLTIADVLWVALVLLGASALSERGESMSG